MGPSQEGSQPPKAWDRNLRKHGIAFEDAVKLFDRPHLESPDDRRDCGEERLIVVGEVRDHVIALVYTWRRQARRIISARKATTSERQIYYQAIYPEEAAEE